MSKITYIVKKLFQGEVERLFNQKTVKARDEGRVLTFFNNLI